MEREKIVEIANQCISSEEGKEVIEYLKSDKRHFDDAAILMCIEKFKIGYMPSHVKGLSGDVHEFAGRIIFPIYDQYSKLVALSSRDFRKDAFAPFFHESFAKSNILYGLNVAKESILKRRQSIIVEGEFDVQYLHSRGFDFTVGILGSAIRLSHIAILRRYCREIFIVCDGDNAGKNATSRIMNVAAERQLKKHFDISLIPVFLPEKKDPDDFLYEKGVNFFVDLLRNARKKYEKEFV